MEIIREDLNKWIAGRLKQYREQRKVSLNRMASLTGRSATALANVENGNSRVSMETAIRYSEILDIPLHQLFGEEVREINPRLIMALRALPPEKAEALADAIQLLYPEYFPDEGPCGMG